jgi:PAS domain S-box-containing protein
MTHSSPRDPPVEAGTIRQPQFDPADSIRAQLAAIVESSDDAIIGKDLNGTILSWNSGAERIFGYAFEEVRGRSITILIPPELLQEETEILSRLRRGERIDHFETVRVAKNGRRLNISLTVSPIRNAEGRLVGASKVARDITSRKESEAERQRLQEELELERQSLAELFQRAPAFMCVLRGPEHVIERANDRYFELLGSREILGKRIREVVPEESGHDYFQALDNVFRTGEPFIGTNARMTLRRNGRLEERILEFVYQALRGPDGAIQGLLAHGIDLTDRVRAEQQLVRLTAESERQRRGYETALSNTADFNYVFDLEGRFTFVNKALLTLWRKNLSEALGKTFFELDYPAEMAAHLHGQIQKVIETKSPLRDETPYTSFKGQRFYEYIFVPVFGSDGSIQAVAGSTRDITDRKTMEDALRRADRKKDDFIALLAHELRNPLAPLRNGVHVLKMAKGNEAISSSTQAMMERQLSHMVRLIDDLMDVSRINRSKMELRRARISLQDVIHAAVETARPAIESEAHQLTISLPDDPVFLNADLTRLAQVFSNLLTNSAKYTRRGGRISLTAMRAGDSITVDVRDNGIGIPKDSLASIFDMFSQVDRSIERSTGGLGIGLALVKGLVEMHGGSVSVESLGQDLGSTFRVRLPFLTDSPQALADLHPGIEVSPSKRRLRILVVDDNPDGADSLTLMLRLMNNEVQTARDGTEAIRQTEAFQPDVVFMDLGLPRLNGLEATRRIRDKPWGKAVKIFALTGWGQEADRELTRHAGCDGHLVKPVSIDDLKLVLG